MDVESFRTLLAPVTAGTAHRPALKGGRAVVRYMLPDGEIEFTG